MTKRDLNQNTAAVLDAARESNGIVVTERGVPRWRVTAYRHQTSPLAQMARDGRYSPPPPEPSPWSTGRDTRTYTDSEVDALLDETRGDR